MADPLPRIQDSAASQQSRRITRLFGYYRLILGILLTAVAPGIGFLADFRATFQFIGQLNPQLYAAVAILYLAQALVTAILLVDRFRRFETAIFVMVLIDILALTTLMYASGGVQTGLSNLILVSVAAGNIVVRGRIGVLLAAIASLAIFYATLLASLKADLSVQAYVQTGLIGAFFFVIAFVIQGLSQRIERSEALAQERAQAIDELEKLNARIIERMQTGVISAAPNGLIQTANVAARRFLGESLTDTDAPGFLPGTLIEQIRQWRRNPSASREPLRFQEGGPMVQTSFTRLDENKDGSLLIYLEDATRTTRQAQQLKLASLGRLTAGIAHEIRNPLGAISQAAQLLRESQSLAESDGRLADIIVSHGQRMNRIIENILQLSRQKTAAPSVFDLQHWAEEVIREALHAAGKPRPTITAEFTAGNVEVACDPSQMRQVLTNLIDNGLRHSAESTGRAVVRIQCGRTRKLNQPVLEVRNPGECIPEELREQIFEPFFTTASQGTGLGLYLSREICEANHAQLDCVPVQDGACFRILFARPEEMQYELDRPQALESAGE